MLRFVRSGSLPRLPEILSDHYFGRPINPSLGLVRAKWIKACGVDAMTQMSAAAEANAGFSKWHVPLPD